MRVLVDTCVVLDVLEKREDFFEDSNNALMVLTNPNHELCLSATQITDIHYILRKFLGSESKTREALAHLLDAFDVLETTNAVCLAALRSPMDDYEDAVVSETALANHVDYILTRNAKDYLNSPVSAIAPEEIIKILAR